jgi:hypothetical protein
MIAVIAITALYFSPASMMAIADDNNMANRRLINVRKIKLFRLILQL